MIHTEISVGEISNINLISVIYEIIPQLKSEIYVKTKYIQSVNSLTIALHVQTGYAK